ncbi:hypothetical protein ACFL2C_03545 [Patescibacteria group bacterium]
MPARTRRKSIRRRSPKKTKKINKTKTLLVLAVSVLFASLWFLYNSSWDHKSKISIAYFDKDSAKVLVFDPTTDSISRLHLHPDTQLDAAYSLGVIKIKNLEEVSVNEELGSVLLSKTLTKNFQIPIPFHSGTGMNSFFEGSLIRSLTTALTTLDSNTDIITRIKLSVFAAKVINSKRIDIDLSNYVFLEESELVDGSSGYVIRREISTSIASLVSDHGISSKSYTSKIVDGTQNKELIGSAVNTIRNSGLVVTNIENFETAQTCLVRSENTDLMRYFEKVFGCESEIRKTITDIEFVFGSNFSDIF